MANPIPQGHHTITPHLVIKGAAAAIEFYKRAFGAEELYRLRAPGANGTETVGHAALQLGDSKLFLADECPQYNSLGPQGASPVGLHLYVEDADAVFDRAVKAGAKVAMPLTNMFWGDRFGKLIDPFGHHWSVATHIEDVNPAQMEERMAAACAEQAAAAK